MSRRRAAVKRQVLPDAKFGDPVVTKFMNCLMYQGKKSVEVRTDRGQALAIRWLIGASRDRSEHTMEERLSGELLDAANNRGNAVKKREDTHRMADANKAFSHYRW